MNRFLLSILCFAPTMLWANDPIFLRQDRAEVVRVQPIEQPMQRWVERQVCSPGLVDFTTPEPSTSRSGLLAGAKEALSAMMSIDSETTSLAPNCQLALVPEWLPAQAGYRVRFVYQGRVLETLTAEAPGDHIVLNVMLVPAVD